MSAQSSNLETLLRAAFAAGISYADGINENGIETVWQMRKDELVPAVETTGEWVRLDHAAIADNEPVRMRRTGSPQVPMWEIWRAVKTSPETSKC